LSVSTKLVLESFMTVRSDAPLKGVILCQGETRPYFFYTSRFSFYL